MNDIIIEKQEKQELIQEYNQKVKAFAREMVDKDTINQDLWDEISKIQKAIRAYDVLKEIKNLLEEQKTIGIPIQKEGYFKALPANNINLLPKKRF